MRRTTELAIGRAYSQPMDREFKMFLRLGVCALRKLPGSLLKSGKGNSAPLRQQAQVRIAAERSLMAELRRGGRTRRHGPRGPRGLSQLATAGLECPRCRTRRERPLQNRLERGGIALRPDPQPVVEIALRPEGLQGDEDAPAGPKRARECDSSVGHVAVERQVHSPRSPKQR